MMTNDLPPPERFRALMARFVELGQMLPQGDEAAMTAAAEDPETRSDIMVILTEMRKVKADMDAILAGIQE
jgi:hypothetical protein